MKIIKQSENRIHLSDREGMETDTHCNYLNSNLPASIIEGLRAGRCTSLFLKARISTEYLFTKMVNTICLPIMNMNNSVLLVCCFIALICSHGKATKVPKKSELPGAK